jgi:hypothetical protein
VYLTFGNFRKYIAKFAGNGGLCESSPEVALFGLMVMEKALLEGMGDYRKYCFHVVDKYITLPYELKTPIKVKIDDTALAKVWSKWTEFYTQDTLKDGVDAGNALYEDPNPYFTVYDIPYTSSIIGALSLFEEDENAFLIVQGLDESGREIITTHKGNQIYGEYLPLRRNVTVSTVNKFAKITGINKSKTNGPVQLYAVNKEKQERFYLAEYTGYEETPEYRRAKLTLQCPKYAKVSILGRIRLKPFYHDNEVIPFDSINGLVRIAQTLNALESGNMQNAASMQQFVDREVKQVKDYNRVGSNQPVDTTVFTSPGAIKNVF